MWFKTEDGQKGTNRPTMILDSFVSKEKNKDSDVIHIPPILARTLKKKKKETKIEKIGEEGGG